MHHHVCGQNHPIWDSERRLCGKVKIKEATMLLYLDFLLRFRQVRTCLNGFFIFTHTSNPKLDVRSGPYHCPNFWLDLGPVPPGSGLNLSLGPDYGSTNCGGAAPIAVIAAVVVVVPPLQPLLPLRLLLLLCLCCYHRCCCGHCHCHCAPTAPAAAIATVVGWWWLYPCCPCRCGGRGRAPAAAVTVMIPGKYISKL